MPVIALGSSRPVGQQCGSALPAERKDNCVIKVQGSDTHFMDILPRLIFFVVNKGSDDIALGYFRPLQDVWITYALETAISSNCISYNNPSIGRGLKSVSTIDTKQLLYSGMDKKVSVISTPSFSPKFKFNSNSKGQSQDIIIVAVRQGAMWKVLCLQASRLQSGCQSTAVEQYTLQAVAYSLSWNILYFIGIF